MAEEIQPLSKSELTRTAEKTEASPNGKTWAPQIMGTKSMHSMNIIDRNGLGPWVLEYRRANPTHGSKKISAAIAQEFEIYVGWRNIDHYMCTFRDPTTGLILPPEKIPAGIPDRRKGEFFMLGSSPEQNIALQMKQILEEQQVDDVTALEDLAESEMVWFKDPMIPIPLKLKVAKELRETIKLKLEVAGAVKPSAQTVNNNLTINTNDIQQLLEAKPEAVNVLRELLYLANKTENSQPETIDVTPGGDTNG